MFTWTVVSTGSSSFFSDMHMNSDIIIASSSSTDSGNNPSSNTVFIHCASGARVYIQCADATCQPRNDRTYGLQTFAGFLVSADAN